MYAEERVGEWEQAAITDHVANCDTCKQKLASLKALVHDLESMTDLSLPADFAAEVADEAAPNQRFKLGPSRRSVWVQAVICLIILVTCCSLLVVVDTPVTDPSNDVLGAVDVLLGSPFQTDAAIVAVLAIMSLAGLGVLSCVLHSSPRAEARRRHTADTRPRRH